MGMGMKMLCVNGRECELKTHSRSPLVRAILNSISLLIVTLLCLHCCTLIAQLAEIRKVSYAKILCENSDFLPKIQPKVMFLPYSEIAAIAKLVQDIVTVTELAVTDDCVVYSLHTPWWIFTVVLQLTRLHDLTASY